jgi:DNA-binding response OmpR family regulator
MSQSKRVLVVDDNQTNCEVLQEMLADEFEVLIANDGGSAMQLAQQYQPTIVLLDVMLPGLSGLDVCRRLRKLPAMSKARIIMVSAKAMPSERAQGLEAGADDYLTKPFDYPDLMAVIDPNSDIPVPLTP